MRLDKLLAHCGLGTRKEVKKIIKNGLVEINGQIIKKDDFQVKENQDQICVDGQPIYYEKYVYIMLNKPAGYISATEDGLHPTVVSLIEGYEHYHLFPVGRLDIDTHGLIFLTNDGLLAHNLLSPKKQVSKIYYAKIDGVVTKADQDLFKAGIELDDFTCMPANLKILNSDDSQSEVEVEIYEGKFHQIKRMFEKVGKKVIYLKRLKMKTLVLDPDLEEGEYRLLTQEELDNLKKI